MVIYLILEIHGVRTMDTFRIIKSLANHLLSLSILLLWQDRQTIWSVYSLSVLVYIWLAAKMFTERLTTVAIRQSFISFPFHFYPTLLRERTVIEHCDWSVKWILAPSLVGDFNNRTDQLNHREHVKRVQYLFLSQVCWVKVEFLPFFSVMVRLMSLIVVDVY